MKLLFIFIAALLAILLSYLIARINISHKHLMKIYINNNSLLEFHMLLTLIIFILFFIILCACNNTFWHLPYLK